MMITADPWTLTTWVTTSDIGQPSGIATLYGLSLCRVPPDDVTIDGICRLNNHSSGRKYKHITDHRNSDT